jgi:hypothetical protein
VVKRRHRQTPAVQIAPGDFTVPSTLVPISDAILATLHEFVRDKSSLLVLLPVSAGSAHHGGA